MPAARVNYDAVLLGVAKPVVVPKLVVVPETPWIQPGVAHPSMMMQTEPDPADLEPGLVSQDGVDASAERGAAPRRARAPRPAIRADWPARNGRSGACHETPAGPH